MRKHLLVAGALLSFATAHGQSPPATAGAAADFPAGAQVPGAPELAGRLSGHTYVAKLANGVTWRMEYNTSGYMFINISTGARDTAKWRAEEGRACFEFRGTFPSGCSEFRVVGDGLYLKRASTGEILALERN